MRELWSTLDDPRRVVASVEVSANVSTNRVFLLRLDDGSRVFAKVSNPFPDQPEFVRPAISVGTIKEIKELAAQGLGPNAIAEITGLDSGMAT